MYVCMYVLSACISQKPQAELHIFLFILITARSSSGGVAIRYVFPVLWMTPCFHIIVLWCVTSLTCIPKWRERNSRNLSLHQFQPNFAQRQRSESTHRGLRPTGGGGKVCSLLPCLFWLDSSRPNSRTAPIVSSNEFQQTRKQLSMLAYGFCLHFARTPVRCHGNTNSHNIVISAPLEATHRYLPAQVRTCC